MQDAMSSQYRFVAPDVAFWHLMATCVPWQQRSEELRSSTLTATTWLLLLLRRGRGSCEQVISLVVGDQADLRANHLPHSMSAGLVIEGDEDCEARQFQEQGVAAIEFLHFAIPVVSELMHDARGHDVLKV